MHKTRRIPFLAVSAFLGLVLLAACGPSRRTIENEGEVCIQPCVNCTNVTATFRPAGCFSSSCYRPIEQRASVRIEEPQHAIRLDTRFVVVRSAPLEAYCTMDCSGAGQVEFSIGDLEEATYSIWLGQHKVGELSVPLPPTFGRDLCFEYEHPKPTPQQGPQPTARPTKTPFPILPVAPPDWEISPLQPEPS